MLLSVYYTLINPPRLFSKVSECVSSFYVKTKVSKCVFNPTTWADAEGGGGGQGV